MAFPELNPTTNSIIPNKAISLVADGFLFVGGAVVAISLLWSLLFLLNSEPSFQPPLAPSVDHGINLSYDPPDPTFYDDPNLSYSIESSIKDWDAKRMEWLKHHPSFASNQILLVSGSQPLACKNTVGDNLLLRFFKNKVDYCRIHGYDIFYNNLLLHPKMTGFWAKYPIIRAAMLAHPEAEWIWWIDSDAVFTDMEFQIPFDKYKDYNLVVHGWSSLVYEKQSWTSINAGVFLIRNCQWSMDFMDVWVSMGPQTPNYESWGQIQRSKFKDKMIPEADDQAALIYLLLKEKEKWGDKIYIEEEYDLQKYWLDVVDAYDNITRGYLEIKREVPSLRRRHAEKVSEKYGASWEQYLKAKSSFQRRPLITHFTGCEPCSGNHNPAYSWDSCFNGMRKALNFADNQVLLNYGFLHQNLVDSSSVSPLNI
ncbi:transferase, putative [Ricinus communis]|uniref:Transferase, putative n=2 Tax=Ricinus communis TaxID=3988 RepID=B9RI53_RICCO|nr:transferase, putative [Ricinus communis]